MYSNNLHIYKTNTAMLFQLDTLHYDGITSLYQARNMSTERNEYMYLNRIFKMFKSYECICGRTVFLS